MARRAAKAPVRPKTIVIAGPGDSTLNNTSDLLNDFLGWSDEIPEDDETTILLPITGPLSSGMKSVIEWLDEEEAAYEVLLDDRKDVPKGTQEIIDAAEDVTSSPNPLADAIIALREDRGADDRDVYLVLLWGEEGDDAAEILLDLAEYNEIPVLDLTRGLDTIEFETGEEAPAEDKTPPWPTEEPEEEKQPEPLAEENEPLTEDSVAQEVVAGPSQETLARVAESLEGKEINPPPPAFTGAVVGAEDVAEALDRARAFFEAWHHTVPGQHGLARVIEARAWLAETHEYVFSRTNDLAVRVEASGDVIQAMMSGGSAADVLKARKTDPSPEPAEEPEEAPEATPAASRGRSRQQTAREYFDEDSGQWVRLQRGRPPKGVELRTIDVKTGQVVQ